MIKWASEMKDGRTLVGFGLSQHNIDKLILGQPIQVDGAQLGMPDKVFTIHYGKTEAAMTKELEDNFGMPWDTKKN